MFNSTFREEALASRGQRQQIDHLLRTTAPHERTLVAGVGVLLLAFLAWALFGSVVRDVTIDGVLVAPGARHDLVSLVPGHLLEFLVEPGEQVVEGQLIARQSAPELDREIAAARNRFELLEAGEPSGAGEASDSSVAAARMALRQLEAQRTVREQIVSHVGGEVTALRVAPGTYLVPGTAVLQVRVPDAQPPRAVVQAAPHVAQRIRGGMQASVEVAVPGGTVRQVAGEVAAVSAAPLPDWLAALGPAAAESSESSGRVDIILHDAADLAAIDGAPARVRIVLGRVRPAVLLYAQSS